MHRHISLSINMYIYIYIYTCICTHIHTMKRRAAGCDSWDKQTVITESCKHILFSESGKIQLILIHIILKQLVVTVEVVIVCWSYD